MKYTSLVFIHLFCPYTGDVRYHCLHSYFEWFSKGRVFHTQQVEGLGFDSQLRDPLGGVCMLSPCLSDFLRLL